MRRHAPFGYGSIQQLALDHQLADLGARDAEQHRRLFRMVGAHHRIPMESIEAFRAWEQEQTTKGMEEVSRLQSELGLVE